MKFAQEIANDDVLALSMLVASLTRNIQSQAITDAFSVYPKDANSGAHKKQNLFFSEFDKLDALGRTFADIAIEIDKPRRIDLATDIVVPQPWSPLRLQRTMSGLRPGGAWGRWKSDPNHQVEWWEPLGIGFVFGGNHSIAAGILSASGRIKPVIAYDITPIYEHVYCDGRAFRRRYDKSVICYASTYEMAAVFEIGRLIVASRGNV